MPAADFQPLVVRRKPSILYWVAMPYATYRHDLFRQRMDALYRTDGRGRMISTNEWDARPPPRFHLMRTPAGPVYRFRADVPDAIAARLAAQCEREPLDLAFETRPACHAPYLDILADHAPVQNLGSGPAYAAAGDSVPTPPPPVAIGPGNAELLRGRFDDWLPDIPHRQPFVAVVRDGRAVALCCSVRISPAVHCAGVETHPAHRRKGHAAAAVAGWAHAVRALGATPFYSTSWENTGSRRVAARLAMELVGVDFHVT